MFILGYVRLRKGQICPAGLGNELLYDPGGLELDIGKKHLPHILKNKNKGERGFWVLDKQKAGKHIFDGQKIFQIEISSSNRSRDSMDGVIYLTPWSEKMPNCFIL